MNTLISRISLYMAALVIAVSSTYSITQHTTEPPNNQGSGMYFFSDTRLQSMEDEATAVIIGESLGVISKECPHGGVTFRFVEIQIDYILSGEISDSDTIAIIQTEGLAGDLELEKGEKYILFLMPYDRVPTIPIDQDIFVIVNAWNGTFGLDSDGTVKEFVFNDTNDKTPAGVFATRSRQVESMFDIKEAVESIALSEINLVQSAASNFIIQTMTILDYRSIAEEITLLDNLDDYTSIEQRNEALELLEQQCWDYMNRRFSDMCTPELIEKLIAARYHLGDLFDAYEQHYDQLVLEAKLDLSFINENIYRYNYAVRIQKRYESGEQTTYSLSGRIGVKVLDGKYLVDTFYVGESVME